MACSTQKIMNTNVAVVAILSRLTAQTPITLRNRCYRIMHLDILQHMVFQQIKIFTDSMC